jgi:hypothetical protein
MRDVLDAEATPVQEVHLSAWDVQVLAEHFGDRELTDG